MNKINFVLTKQEEEAYIKYSNDKFNSDLEICKQNNANTFFKIMEKDLNELIELLPQTKESTKLSFERRSIKYIDLSESYKLVKYQFSKYSNKKRSFTEGVYSNTILEIVKVLNNSFDKELEIADVGSGPSRIVYELSQLFQKANFELYDFSITNLYLANKLLSSNKIVEIPSRKINNFGDNNTNEDIEILRIQNKNNKNIKYNVCNLEKDFYLKDNKYDIINSTHCINLLKNPDKIILNLISKLKINGILIISDLLGWKENRSLNMRFFPDGNHFYSFFEKITNIEILSYWYGGPYIEEYNSERSDHYINHTIVVRRIK